MSSTRCEIREACTDHILQCLAATEPHSKPYPHFWAQNFLPAEIYDRLLAEAPETNQFDDNSYGRENKNGSINRFSMHLINEKINSLPLKTRDLWYGVRDAVGSVATKRAVFTKLAEGLAYRYGIAKEQVAEVEAYPSCMIMRESEGYYIKPHPDARSKVVTLQVALPQDNAQRDLGTSLYRLSCNPAHLMREPRGFCEVERYPFVPNSVFAFSVVNTARLRSWHGRTTLPMGCGVRNTLLTVYYANAANANPDIVNEQYRLTRAA